ncbi:NAD(P)-binding protein [Dissoconium aciculare CBS 342.82]|uniref:NAD(P)-binding protein n=1 Tax=Dissoconium aciculare CBS 342.82 TaxID=1314786 RepID=A0A6J3MJG3_9PEZI|nr:NAD(P)-binding protein [Dissoconium aciculare CBS 342.82]KAF1827889.1 NAD(P)-binding protein [Dissoconium aciculare CBS 342.82]
MAAPAPVSNSQHANRTVLVTGGGGGLGRVIVEHFLSVGANVVTCDINAELLADFTAKVTSAYPEKTLAVQCDITSEAALDELFAQIETKFGKLDYVVNSAGIMDRFDPAGTIDRALFERVLAVNLIAPTMISKRAINLMQKHQIQGGAIVNIASIAAFKGGAAGAAYTASKHGILGLTRNTAAFYHNKGIRCNAIQAGAMATNIGNSMAGGYNQQGLELAMRQCKICTRKATVCHHADHLMLCS